MAEGQGQQQEQGGGNNMMRLMMQMMMVSMAVNFFAARQKPQQQGPVGGESGEGMPGMMSEAGEQVPGGRVRRTGFSNLYGPVEECELFVHLGEGSRAPGLPLVLNDTLAAESGYQLLWRTRVWYENNANSLAANITLRPFSPAELSGSAVPHVHATLLRAGLLELPVAEVPGEQVVAGSLPLVAMLKELDAGADAVSLFSEDSAAEPVKPKNNSGAKLPYLKTKVEVRPVYDHTVHSPAMLQQAPFKRLVAFPAKGVYQPYLYVSDFWLLEKDYMELNETLTGRPLNLSLSYSTVSAMMWTLQVQMADQWTQQGNLGLMNTQRDSFMLKRLLTDTNPYLLAFSGLFILLHTVFSWLAFKNEIQFWRKNESMEGLSARSMCVSFVSQLITSLYLLDSQETSKLILFEILVDTALAFWKLRKAVKMEFKPAFPFVSFSGQKGYEANNTSQYDSEALRYMGAFMTPLFLGYTAKSMLYGKHRGWYSFLVSTAAGGVYTFGFAMMTPQLYINYKLKSVEHLPWRALTYKAFNTFVDDVAAMLIDMPMMHRLSCFRDDIVFFIYIYQRWKYRVDKSRASIWAEAEKEVAKEAEAKAIEGQEPAGDAATAPAASSESDAAAPAPADAPQVEEQAGAEGTAEAQGEGK